MKNIAKIIIIFIFSLYSANAVLAADTKIIGDKEFIQISDFWVDKNFVSDEQVIEIKYDSVSYNALLSDNPDLAQYEALGHNYKINFVGQNFIILDNAKPSNIEKKSNANINIENSISKNVYTYAAIGILFIFLIGAVILVVISRLHKKQREE